MAMGSRAGVQIEALSFPFSPFCPGAWITIHSCATASALPKLPRRGAWQFGDYGENSGAVTYV